MAPFKTGPVDRLLRQTGGGWYDLRHGIKELFAYAEWSKERLRSAVERGNWAGGALYVTILG